MPHSWPCTGAAAPCVEHCASNRAWAGQLTWCHVKDSSRYASSWRRTCQSRQAMIGTQLLFTPGRAPWPALPREPAPAPALRAVRSRSRALSRGRLCPFVPRLSCHRKFQAKATEQAGWPNSRLDDGTRRQRAFLQVGMTGRLQLAAAAVCAAVAVIAAGCGGKAKTGVSGESGASLVTSGALAYVSIDSDFGSSQWRKLDSLVKKFSIRDRPLAELKRGLSEQKIDYDRDIKPALGPEVDIVVTAGGSPNNISYAALTKPDSIEKAKALVHKLDEQSPPPSATRVVHGWLFVADKQEMIDSVLKGTGSSLAD